MILALIVALFSAGSDTLPLPEVWPNFDPVRVRESDPPMPSLAGKVRFFLYFSPDCSHCQELWPTVQAAFAKARPSGLEVGAIAMRGQTRDDVADFVEGLGMDNPLWMDSTGTIAETFRIHSVPRAYLVARDGRVQVFRGLSPKRLGEVMAIAFREALRR